MDPRVSPLVGCLSPVICWLTYKAVYRWSENLKKSGPPRRK